MVTPNAAIYRPSRANSIGAIANYEQAISIDPNWVEAHRSLAWLWATCPSPLYRDTDRALVAAEAALALTRSGDSFVLDAAAAAHANAGHFDKAIELQQKALANAPPDIVESMRERLALYQQGQPFRSRPTTAAIEQASHAAEPTHTGPKRQRGCHLAKPSLGAGLMHAASTSISANSGSLR